MHKGGASNPGDRLKRLENPSSITENSVNVFTVPDGGIVLEASKTYFVQVKTTSSDRVAVSVTDTDSDGNDEDAGGAKNWTINNDSSTNRPSIGAWQESNQSMRIDVKGQVLLPPPDQRDRAEAVAPMRVTLEWDRVLAVSNRHDRSRRRLQDRMVPRRQHVVDVAGELHEPARDVRHLVRVLPHAIQRRRHRARDHAPLPDQGGRRRRRERLVRRGQRHDAGAGGVRRRTDRSLARWFRSSTRSTIRKCSESTCRSGSTDSGSAGLRRSTG